MSLNVNANDYCINPDVRTGKVVAITSKAIIVADTANPAGGFTDAEYQSIGVTFDTLVDPVDRAAFGDATDIDNNGHVIMFFTRAVNEMTGGDRPRRRARILLQPRSAAQVVSTDRDVRGQQRRRNDVPARSRHRRRGQRQQADEDRRS